ncbi:MAG: hypothetical protein ACKVWR_07460 [Acidimicrobiales bacterium]
MTSAADQTRPEGDEERLPRLSGQRRHLRRALLGLEEALARPLPGREGAWAESVHARAGELADAYALHVSFTEAPGGFFDDVLLAAPALAADVEALQAEHRTIAEAVRALLEALAAGPDAEEPTGWARAQRAAATRLIGSLTLHRQLGADLTHEAFPSLVNLPEAP